MVGIAAFQRGREGRARNADAGQGRVALHIAEPRALEHAVEIPALRGDVRRVGAERIGVHVDRAGVGRGIDLVDAGVCVEIADIEAGVVAPAEHAGCAPEIHAGLDAAVACAVLRPLAVEERRPEGEARAAARLLLTRCAKDTAPHQIFLHRLFAHLRVRRGSLGRRHAALVGRKSALLGGQRLAVDAGHRARQHDLFASPAHPRVVIVDHGEAELVRKLGHGEIDRNLVAVVRQENDRGLRRRRRGGRRRRRRRRRRRQAGL